jgi:flagellar FliJ protein
VRKFVFKLEPLLTARRRAEQDKQRVVGDLERERRDLEDTLRRHQEFISEGKRELAGRLVGSVRVAALRDHAGSTINLMRHAHRVLLELAGLHKRLDAAREELVEATRKRRAVELLREQRYAEWRKRLNRLENDALDELAVQAAGRSERSSP